MTDVTPASEDNDTLDILLLPFPFELEASDFVAAENEGRNPSDLHKDKRHWESFRICQRWIDTPGKRDALVAQCCDLLQKSRTQTRRVNGVVFPEYALDYELFDKLCKRMKKIAPSLEFVVAGSSNNCEGLKGNTLLTRAWRIDDANKHLTNSRQKQHRWRLDRRQVDAYALGTSLNPKIRNWWETSPLGLRELHFHRFRESSVFAALICEELARSDSCHDVLRSVAPNIVFALLMDGPQIKERWPAQYASNLADDPGSAVLTFTSYGLIDRSNRQGKFPPNHSVALWKDDAGGFVNIPLPTGHGPRGVLLSLWAEHVVDMTITGKQSQVRAWRYSSHYPVTL